MVQSTLTLPNILCYMFYNLTTDKWSPALQIRTVLLSIQALLSAPNPDDPLANDVAELWKIDEEKAIKNGMFMTQLNDRHFINPLTPMLPVTAPDEPWPLFHF